MKPIRRPAHLRVSGELEGEVGAVGFGGRFHAGSYGVSRYDPQRLLWLSGELQVKEAGLSLPRRGRGGAGSFEPMPATLAMEQASQSQSFTNCTQSCREKAYGASRTPIRRRCAYPLLARRNQ
jgi:hypothetical protein